MPTSSGEHEIADAVQALLSRANQGPDARTTPRLSQRDRRVAARTTTAGPARSRPPRPSADGEETGQVCHDTAQEPADDPERVAKIIPLPIFDAREEAKKWW